MFLTSMAAMEGASVPDRLQSAFKPALVKGWMVWPWVQLVNFRFVPLDYRVMAVNVVALGRSFWGFSLEKKKKEVLLISSRIQAVIFKSCFLLSD